MELYIRGLHRMPHDLALRGHQAPVQWYDHNLLITEIGKAEMEQPGLTLVLIVF